MAFVQSQNISDSVLLRQDNYGGIGETNLRSRNCRITCTARPTSLGVNWTRSIVGVTLYFLEEPNLHFASRQLPNQVIRFGKYKWREKEWAARFGQDSGRSFYHLWV